jgi:hypothetical protein
MEVEEGLGASVSISKPTGVEECWMRSTEFWKTSASWPCAFERMPLTSMFVGSPWSWTLANWIFLVFALTQAPWARLLTFEKRALHAITLPVAASSQADQSKSREGAVGGGGGSLPMLPTVLSSHLLHSRKKSRSSLGSSGVRPYAFPIPKWQVESGPRASLLRLLPQFALLSPPRIGRPRTCQSETMLRTPPGVHYQRWRLLLGELSEAVKALGIGQPILECHWVPSRGFPPIHLP